MGWRGSCSMCQLVSLTLGVGLDRPTPSCMLWDPRRVDVKSEWADSEGWRWKLASVSAPFVSPSAPLSGTANLWRADKQLIDYGAAGGRRVYIVTPGDGFGAGYEIITRKSFEGGESINRTSFWYWNTPTSSQEQFLNYFRIILVCFGMIFVLDSLYIL